MGLRTGYVEQPDVTSDDVRAHRVVRVRDVVVIHIPMVAASRGTDFVTRFPRVKILKHADRINRIIMPGFESIFGCHGDLLNELSHDLGFPHLGREEDLASLEEGNHEIEAGQLVCIWTDAGSVLCFCKVEPDVPGQLLRLNPVNECCLLAGDLNAYRLWPVL